MILRRCLFSAAILLAYILPPLPAAAMSMLPGGPPLLHPDQTARLARVQGIIQGINAKLTAVSQRLDTYHAATQSPELHSAISVAKIKIEAIISDLNAVPNSEQPRQLLAAIREKLQLLREQLKVIRGSL